MDPVIVTMISSLGTLGAFIFALAAFLRNRKLDDSTEGKQDGAVLTEIGYIKSGIDDIKRKQEQQDKQHIEVIARITSVEASAKQAQERLDRIERKEAKGV